MKTNQRNTRTVFYLDGSHSVEPLQRLPYNEWMDYVHRTVLRATLPTPMTAAAILVAGYDMAELKNEPFTLTHYSNEYPKIRTRQ